MRTKEQLARLSFGDSMTFEEAVFWLGQDHIAWLKEHGQTYRLEMRQAGEWVANNGAAYIAYDAIRREWKRDETDREIVAREREQEAADLRNGRYSTLGEEVA